MACSGWSCSTKAALPLQHLLPVAAAGWEQILPLPSVTFGVQRAALSCYFLVLSLPEMMLCSTLCLSMASRYLIHSPTVQGQFLTARSWADKTNSFTFSCLSWKSHRRKVKFLSARETTQAKLQLIKNQHLKTFHLKSTFILYLESSDGYFKFYVPKNPVNTFQWGRTCSAENHQAGEVFSAKEINTVKALSEFPTVPRMSGIQRGSTPSLFCAGVVPPATCCVQLGREKRWRSNWAWISSCRESPWSLNPATFCPASGAQHQLQTALTNPPGNRAWTSGFAAVPTPCSSAGKTQLEQSKVRNAHLSYKHIPENRRKPKVRWKSVSGRFTD